MLDQSLIAALGAVVGGMVTGALTLRQKNIENKQKNAEMNHDDLSQVRKELRERCDKLQAESDHWRAKYYADMIELKEQIFHLRADNAALKIQLDDMKSRGWVPKEERARYQ